MSNLTTPASNEVPKGLALPWVSVGPAQCIYWGEGRRWVATPQECGMTAGELYVRAQQMAAQGISSAEHDAAIFAKDFGSALKNFISDYDLKCLLSLFAPSTILEQAPTLSGHALPAGISEGLTWTVQPKYDTCIMSSPAHRWAIQVETSDLPLGADLARHEALSDLGIYSGDLDSYSFALSWRLLFEDKLTPRVAKAIHKMLSIKLKAE